MADMQTSDSPPESIEFDSVKEALAEVSKLSEAKQDKVASWLLEKLSLESRRGRTGRKAG